MTSQLSILISDSIEVLKDAVSLVVIEFKSQKPETLLMCFDM